MIKRGTYKIIRVNGTEETVPERPTLPAIYKAIGCDTIDTVMIDRRSQIVMIVDDTGMIDGKPANAKATALYHSVCRPGTVHQIHGDVAIANDEDFA